MSDTLDNPVIKEDLGAKFLEAAALSDRGEDVPASLLPDQSEIVEQVETEENVPTEAELADPANKDRARDKVSGKFIKKAAGATALDAAPDAVDALKTAADAPTGELSEFEKKKQEKAAKDKERQDRSWENLNREKDELARRRQELSQFEQQLRNPQRQRQAAQPREYSSKQFFEASQDFKTTARNAFKRYQETGDEAALDEFNKNDQWAEQAQQNAIEFYALEEQEGQQTRIQQQQGVWVRNMETIIKSDPELAKADSPISLQLQELLKTDGQILQLIPNGFAKAVEIARLRLDAKDAPSLREQLKTVKAEIDRLNGLTQPSTGGVPGPAQKKSFDDMKPEDQWASIQRSAAALDAG